MKKRTTIFKVVILFLLIFLFYNNTLNAQLLDSVTLKIKKCIDFEPDGKGGSANWQSTEWIGIPARSKAPVSYVTRAKVLYSGKGIYFLFDCEDTKLTATMKADFLNLYEEDVVEVFLWTKEDFPVYFEYEISPLNYELPIIVPNYKGKFFGWRPWKYEGERKTRHQTSIKDGVKESGAAVKGWTAEFFIPFSLLVPLQQVPPVSGTKWRANMYRIDYDQGKGVSYAWLKTRTNFHDYEKYGTFVFE